jgi:RNA recognition motif-containing protein
MTTKVFVGNLVFSTTDEDLKEAFSTAAPVVSANIITRGRRSLGYGFVEFASETEAEKAVAAMNKKEIAGRPINVEVARPRDPAKEAEAREKKAVRVSKPRPVKVEGSPSSGEGAAAADGSSPNARRRRGPRRGGVRKADGASASSAPGADGVVNSYPEGPAPRRGRNNNNNNNNAVASSSNGAAAAPAPRTRAPRAPKRPTETRPTSETTLFVANVPFTTDDAQLLAFFEDHKPKSAHVVRMRNGRSRGYGFVEFEDSNGQTAGLAVDGKDVPLPNGTTMKLSVKVAMTPPVITASETTEEAAPGETPK